MQHIRFDIGELRKPHRTGDGVLLAEATFARDGVLDYRRSDGSTRKELRLPETNKDSTTLTSFGLAPITTEHPPVLVNEDNAKDYRKGISLQDVRYETVSGKGGFVRGQVALMDSDAISLAESGKKIELSAGYTCDLEETPGVWRGQRYDAIQRNVRVNHIALTTRGRAGPDVRVHLDSKDEVDVAVQIHSDSTDPSSFSPPPSIPPKRMAGVICEGRVYSDIPEDFAAIAGPKLKQLETLQGKHDSLTEETSELRQQVADLEEEKRDHEGRADGYEIRLTNAEMKLEELGYQPDGVGSYVKTDTKDGKHGKKPPFMEDLEEEEIGDEEMEDDEEPQSPPPKKSKKAKKDSAAQPDVKVSAKELMAAWREADRLVSRDDDGQSFSDKHFDSAETPAAIRRLVIAELQPKIKSRLDSASDAYVEGIYDAFKEDILQRADTDDREDSNFRADAADDLITAINAARNSGSSNRVNQAMSESAQRRMNAHKQPLSVTKER